MNNNQSIFQNDYLHGTHPEEQARLSILNDLLNESSLQELRLRGGEKILDVGCGLGQLSRAMARAVEPNGKVIGIERSEEQLQEARRLAAKEGEADLVDFRQGEVATMPLTKSEWGSFDLVHTRFLLEHLPDPLHAVHSMLQAIRPGGRIVLEDDDHDILRLWPEPAHFPQLWSAYTKTYEWLGNDPNVGRRLVSILCEAGATPVRNTMLFIGSCAGSESYLPCVENLIGVIAGARESVVKAGLLDAAGFEQAIEELHKWRQLPDATMWYAISWVEGRK